MKSFEYVRVSSVAEAVQLAASRPDARLLAGGTNLVDLMKLGVEEPGLLIDVRRAIETEVSPRADGGVRIGAGATNSRVAAAPVVRDSYPAVSEALVSGASAQLRNLATVGGNLLQRTRCLYFQDLAKPCNKRNAGSGCSAQDGDSRALGILGTSAVCAATHPSDLAVALAALDAEVHVTGPDGDRVVPLVDLHRLPADDASRDTVLGPADVITAVELPPPRPGTRSRYRKVRDRASFAFALVSVAAVVDVSDRGATDVRIALGGVAPRPWRAVRAEEALRGAVLTERAVGAAVDLDLEAARPLHGNAFKVTLARNLVVQTVAELAA
ncbi:MAG TPA: xanthine dehydrogenase family protein subunit M [Gaiellaceae bacterium]|nr:xanthine dehydrogenase family protein subunit M [Gaiellaceae bacterium]